MGDRLNQTITHTGAGPGNFHWTVFNEQFTALQNTTSLEFTSLTASPNGHAGGIMLDAVQVTLAPIAAVVPRQSFVMAGQSNLGEYRAGTSPTNAASCLKLEGVTHANGQTTVSFNAVSNQTYTVEWCSDLSGAWTRLTDLVARTNSRVESVTDSGASDAARFYRVLTPRRP